MDEKKISVVLPEGASKEGIDVPIKESNERWSEMTLEDGAIIRIKFSVMQIIKINNEYDRDGNPLYVVKGSPNVLIVSVPDELLKK